MPDVTLPHVLSNNPPNTQIVDAVALNDNFNAIVAALNDLDEANLALALQRRLGLTSGTQKGRALVYNNGTGTRTSASYGDLTDAPDVATGIYVPAGGLVRVGFQAAWKVSTLATAPRAAIFVGANQLKIAGPNMVNPMTSETGLGGSGSGGVFQVLHSSPVGLVSSGLPTNDYAGDVATGQVIGGVGIAGDANPIVVYFDGIQYYLADQYGSTPSAGFFHAGGSCEFKVDPQNPVTVDIGVKYKSNGTITVSAKQRYLTVEVVGF